MSIQAGTGISHHRNPLIAGQEAVQKALKAGRMDRADFIFAFASIGYDQTAVVRAIRETSGGAPLSGCSAEGVITGDEADETNFSVAVMAIKSGRLRFCNGLQTGLKKDSRGTGTEMARSLQEHIAADALGLFLFPDGITLNYDRLQEGLETNLTPAKKLPIFGGSAGDNWKFKKVCQYCNDEVVSDGVSWVLISGQARLSWGVGHGYVPVGVEHKVTRAQGNTIYELDSRTVVDVLGHDYLEAENFEDMVKTIQTFTFGIKAPSDMKDYDRYIIRSLVGGINEEDGSATLPTEIREGESLRVAQSDFDSIRTGNRRVLKQALDGASATAPFALVFQFECCTRGNTFMPEKTKLEMIRELRREIGFDIPWLGFYAFGEIGPVNGRNYFHNGSMVLVTLQ